MDIVKVRRQRLSLLEAEHGQSELVRITGLPQSYLSNLKHGRASFGEKAARKIEKLAGKPYLWLDDIDISTVETSEIARHIRIILDSVPESVRLQLLRELSNKK